MVQNHAPLWYQRGLKWSQMDKNSQNAIANLFKEKKVSVTHGKKGIWPPKPSLSEVFGVKWPLFDLQRPFFFAEDVKNQVRKLLGGRKVGVTHEKWLFDPKNSEIRAKQWMMSHHTIWKGQKTAKVSPQFAVRWFNRKLTGWRKVSVTHEKWAETVIDNSKGGVRSQVGPKCIKSSRWEPRTGKQWWVMEKNVIESKCFNKILAH